MDSKNRINTINEHIRVAKLISEFIIPCFGPKGLNKIIISDDKTIISDSASTILKEVKIKHPVAKLIAEIAYNIKKSFGDGSNSISILVGELANSAEKLINKKIHPMIILDSWKIALEYCLDNIPTIKIDRSNINKIAETYISKTFIGSERKYVSELLSNLLLSLKYKDEIDLDNVIIKQCLGKNIKDSEIVEGVVIRHELADPNGLKYLKNTKIAICTGELNIKSVEESVYKTKIEINDPEKLKNIKKEYKKQLKNKIDKICNTGAKILLLEKGLPDAAIEIFTRRKIIVVRRLIIEDLERISKTIGSKIVSYLEDITTEDLGKAEIVEERILNGEKWLYILGGQKRKIITLMLRGSTEMFGLTRASRVIKDGLKVLKKFYNNPVIVCGGGACEIELSIQLREFAKKYNGKEMLCINAFADALESITNILIKNSGLKSIYPLVKLKHKHLANEKFYGINGFTRKIVDMRRDKIFEVSLIKQVIFQSAFRICDSLLRIDQYLINKQAKNREEELEEERKKYLEPERVKKIKKDYGIEN